MDEQYGSLSSLEWSALRPGGRAGAAEVEPLSPPRWRQWATADDAESPARLRRRPPGRTGAAPAGAQPQDAAAVLEQKLLAFREALALSGGRDWSWSRPCWALLFDTAAVLRDPVPGDLRSLVVETFAGVGDTIPCLQCRAHFRQKWAEFPAHPAAFSRQSVLDWVTMLKREVDEMVRRRQRGEPDLQPAAAAAERPQAPRAAVPTAPPLQSLGGAALCSGQSAAARQHLPVGPPLGGAAGSHSRAAAAYARRRLCAQQRDSFGCHQPNGGLQLTTSPLPPDDQATHRRPAPTGGVHCQALQRFAARCAAAGHRLPSDWAAVAGHCSLRTAP